MIKMRDLPDGGVLVTDEKTATEKRGVIEQAALDDKMVDITYLKKTTGNVVKRRIAPYEYKQGKLYASCQLHGMQIHSFIKVNIIDARESKRATFKRLWPNKTLTGR